MPAAIVLGTSTFTMSALPGTPSIQNAIPMPFFGTTPFAAPGLGIIASLIMLGFGLFWLARAESQARRAGEGFGTARQPPPLPPPPTTNWFANAPPPRASSIRPKSAAVVQATSAPPIVLAALPLAVVVAVNLPMSLVILPRLDFHFSAEAAMGQHSLGAVAGVWSVVVALAAAIAAVIAFNFAAACRRCAQSMDAGANASVLPAVSVASLVGFGAVIAALPAFAVVRDWVLASRADRWFRWRSPPMCWRH